MNIEINKNFDLSVVESEALTDLAEQIIQKLKQGYVFEGTLTQRRRPAIPYTDIPSLDVFSQKMVKYH